MKDFTKTQEKSTGKAEALKCNKCNTVVTAFGVKAGDPCALIHHPGEPQGMSDNSDARSSGGGCIGGRYMKIDAKSADNAKRRTDGAA